ncbi:MAG TPA: hypothetical protein VIX12_10055 [Candidatus Binataceae bacterium]
MTTRTNYAAPPTLVARLPIHFFAIATVFFCAGTLATPYVVSDLVVFFYQPRVLALTHTFTLGWITATIMGVMYRYVPALTRHPLPYPRLATAQLALFLIGVIGLIAHMALNSWVGTWFSAGVLVISVLMFAGNLSACLMPKFGAGVAESGMMIAILFLLTAAVLGLLMALDKTFNFLPGSVLTNIAGHADFAAIGWVTLTICAASYRFLPAFLLPKLELPRAAIWQLYGLAIGVVALGVTLIARAPGAVLWTALIEVSLISYIVTIGRLIRSRRMPFDWTARHAIAGIAWLVIAGILGMQLAWIGASSEVGNRLAGAYGALGLVGWITNFIIGMSYHLFPGFVARARAVLQWPACTVSELSVARPRPFVFFALNAGILILASGLIAASTMIAAFGAIAIAAGALVYCPMTWWTLSYAYRRGVPVAAKTEFRIIPN